MYAFSTVLNSLVSTIINISYFSLFYTIEETGNSFLKYPLNITVLLAFYITFWLM